MYNNFQTKMLCGQGVAKAHKDQGLAILRAYLDKSIDARLATRLQTLCNDAALSEIY